MLQTFHNRPCTQGRGVRILALTSITRSLADACGSGRIAHLPPSVFKKNWSEKRPIKHPEQLVSVGCDCLVLGVARSPKSAFRHTFMDALGEILVAIIVAIIWSPLDATVPSGPEICHV